MHQGSHPLNGRAPGTVVNGAQRTDRGCLNPRAVASFSPGNGRGAAPVQSKDVLFCIFHQTRVAIPQRLKVSGCRLAQLNLRLGSRP